MSLAGLVLPGGGVRGAYEVGVVAGIVDALGLRRDDAAPFQVFTGSSVGAINAGFLAANCHRGDLAIGELVDTWNTLELDIYIRPRLPRRFLAHPERFGSAILDPGPLEDLVRNHVRIDDIHRLADAGTLAALIVTALDVGTGRTTMFAEIGSGASFRPSRDPMRTSRKARITAQHILASAALPIFFPARRIDGRLYVDGGLRFNTPMAPAIRCGVDRLVIVPTLYRSPTPVDVVDEPSPLFMAGKLLNALIADTVDRDVQVLERFNGLLHMLGDVLDPADQTRFDDVVTAARGAPYREVDALVIRPSQDIGRIAGDHLRNTARGTVGYFLRKLLSRTGSREADWASYVLFDARFAGRLIELGRNDALAQQADIRRFFSA